VNLTALELEREIEKTGFPADTLEKAIRLIGLMNALWSHPFLKKRLALKGGTALNLFLLDLPRLSVDLDINYIGSMDRERMLEERPKVEQAIRAACEREGMTAKRIPSEHAGGKWRPSFLAVSGQTGSLELDVNFLLRTPLWPPEYLNSSPVGSYPARQILLLERHELAAGKLAALFTRNASRDVFDALQLFQRTDSDRKKLRLAFVIYGGASRREWRTISVNDIRIDQKELENRLIPTLATDLFKDASEIKGWANRLTEECRELCSVLLPLTPEEHEFITQLNNQGQIKAELLTSDALLQDIISQHPALQWKALNVKKYLK
jgi:predicted nucleotidyltransferase component of viral defense system